MRGFGETAPGVATGKGPSFFGSDVKESFLGLHLSRPLLGQRVYDLLAIIDTLFPGKVKRPLHLIGVGVAGPVALHAASAQSPDQNS